MHYVHFLHVGKTGGTAIRHVLPNPFATSKVVGWLETHRFTLSDLPPRHRAVIFLRDPVSRFVSGFNSRQRHGRPRHSLPWTEDEADAFMRFDNADALASALSDSRPSRRREAERAMHSIAHVNTPLEFWLGDECSLRSRCDRIEFVGLQARLEADFEVLKALLGLPAALSLPDDDVAAHRAPSGTSRRLSVAGERNIRRWYASDYALLRCCAELLDTARMPSRGLLE